MRISHRELDVCIRDPSQWVRAKLEPKRPGPRTGYDAVLKRGIHRLHKGDSLDTARRYVEAMFQRSERLRNGKRILDALFRLESYEAWLASSGTMVADSAPRVEMDFGFLQLGGQVDRIDLTESGHRGILFRDNSIGWEQELRMPVLQRALARMYGVPTAEFAVGVQRLDGSGLAVRAYTEAEIQAAVDELFVLAERVRVAHSMLFRARD